MANLWYWFRSHLRAAFHTVWRKRRSYLPLFLSLLLVEILLFSLTMTVGIHYRTESDAIDAEYDYHLSIRGLSQYEAYILMNDQRSVFTSDMVYRIVDTKVHEQSGSDPVYDVYIRFLPDNMNYGISGILSPATPQTCFQNFDRRYSDVYTDEDGAYTATLWFSPLYQTSSLYWQNVVIYILLVIPLLCLSAWAVRRVFLVHLEKDRFTYGIYMAFGADTRRMRSVVGWEMLASSYLVAPLALPISLGGMYWLYAMRDLPFRFDLLLLLLPPLLCIPLVLLVIARPLKKMGGTEPLSLIAAKDNADMITPPCRTTHLYGKGLARCYEGLTILRYRRHYIRLALTSAFLCTIFLCSLYTGYLYRIQTQVDRQERPDFSIKFSSTDVPAEAQQALAALASVSQMHKGYPLYSMEENGLFAAASEEARLPLSGIMTDPLDDTKAVWNQSTLVGITDEQVLAYFSSTYTVTGDLARVLQEPDTIAISNTIRNRQVFQFSVGDTICIATPVCTFSPIPDADMLTGDGLLQEMILHTVYEYHTYTIGAILEDYPSLTGGMPILVNAEDFTALSGQVVRSCQLHLSIDASITADAYTKLQDSIYDIARQYGATTISAANRSFYDRMQQQLPTEELMTLLAVVFLCMIPIFWTFSQHIFAQRRSLEHSILQSLGYTKWHIFLQHCQDVVLLLPSVLPAILLSLSGVYAIYWVVNDLLPFLQITGTLCLPFYVPTAPYILCFSLTLTCCAINALIPYFRFRFSQIKDPYEPFGQEGL